MILLEMVGGPHCGERRAVQSAPYEYCIPHLTMTPSWTRTPDDLRNAPLPVTRAVYRFASLGVTNGGYVTALYDYQGMR